MSSITFTAPMHYEDGKMYMQVPAVNCARVEAINMISREKHGGYVTVKIDTPRRPRTTGPHSQNSRFHGHCRDIADQLDYTEEEVKAAMKRMAVENGYPTHLSIDGIQTPLPTRYATVEEMSYLLQTISKFADEHNLYLTEYDDAGIPYHSVGGRSRKEMENVTT